MRHIETDMAKLHKMYFVYMTSIWNLHLYTPDRREQRMMLVSFCMHWVKDLANFHSHLRVNFLYYLIKRWLTFCDAFCLWSKLTVCFGIYVVRLLLFSQFCFPMHNGDFAPILVKGTIEAIAIININSEGTKTISITVIHHFVIF